MSKKDYILLVQALKDSKPEGFPQMTDDYKNFFAGKQTAWSHTCETLSIALQSDNPRFNRAKFLQACGYND